MKISSLISYKLYKYETAPRIFRYRCSYKEENHLYFISRSPQLCECSSNLVCRIIFRSEHRLRSISFDLGQKEVDAIAKKEIDAVTKFLAHMKKVEAALPHVPSDFSFSVRVDFDLIKKKPEIAVKASVVGADEADLTVTADGDNIPAGFS